PPRPRPCARRAAARRTAPDRDPAGGAAFERSARPTHRRTRRAARQPGAGRAGAGGRSDGVAREHGDRRRRELRLRFAAAGNVDAPARQAAGRDGARQPRPDRRPAARPRRRGRALNGVRHDAAARDARAPLPSAVLTPGARFGIVAGTCGWAFALAAVAAACDARLFLRVGVPAAAGSLVAARAVLRLVERRLRAGLAERARFKTVFGLALVLVPVVGSVLT